MGLFIAQSCREDPTAALSPAPSHPLATPSKHPECALWSNMSEESENWGASAAEMAALSDPYGGHYWPWEAGLSLQCPR